MKTFIIKLTEEKFKEIYSNKELRNQVAHANNCVKQNGVEYQKTCSYPVEYLVTNEQIKKANEELEQSKKQTIADNKGVLLLIGMGCTRDIKSEDEINNHRVRANFYNKDGQKCFIEACINTNGKMYFPHSFIKEGKDPENNNRILIPDVTPQRDYTKTQLLKVVNEYFKCSFEFIYIDNYDLSPDDVISDCRI